MDKQNAINKILAPAVEISLPTGRDAQGDLVFDTFKLAFDFRAICDVKAATGKSLLNGSVWETIEDDPELLSAILWAGLHGHQPELTIEQVRAMMFVTCLVDTLPKIIEAWCASSPKPKQQTDFPAETTKEPAASQK